MRLLISTVLISIAVMSGSCTGDLSTTNAVPAPDTKGDSLETLLTPAQAGSTVDVPVPAAGTKSTQRLTAHDVLEAHESVLRDIYTTVTPSVVHILAISDADNSDWTVPSQGEGSGFVWDINGHIVTNFHVVDGAEKVVVTFWDGKQEPAAVLGQDPFSDLAVLKVDPGAISLSPVTLGDDNSVHVGDMAIAIGHPFRQRHTMTAGIISALGRTRPSGTTQFSIPDVIQTDAPINPGNSGGPLLNRLGEVIGINTQIISSGSGANSGIGFAVPINTAKRVIPSLIEEKEYEYGWLGITGINLTPLQAKQLNLPEITKGVYVHSIVKDSPADSAGLSPSGDPTTYADKQFPEGGSVIVSIDGEPVTGMDQLISYLVRMTRPGDIITLGIVSAEGNRTETEAILGIRPEVLP